MPCPSHAPLATIVTRQIRQQSRLYACPRPFAIRGYTRHRLCTYMVGGPTTGSPQSYSAHLDGFDFEVEGNQGKDEALQGDAQRGNRGPGAKKNLPSSLVRDNRKREGLPDLRCPECRPTNRSLPSTRIQQRLVSDPPRLYLGTSSIPTSKAMWSLPTRISSSCFPTMFFFGQFVSSSLHGCGRDQVRYSQWLSMAYALCDFAGFHNPFELLHDQRSNPHWGHASEKAGRAWNGTTRTLFPDQTVIAVVGVVGIA